MSEKIYNMVDLETIEKLADLVAAKDLGEITIADGEKTIEGLVCAAHAAAAGRRTGCRSCCNGGSGRSSGCTPEAGWKGH